MKLTSLQFAVLVATLCMVAGGAYKAGQDSRPSVEVIHCLATPVAIPTPAPATYRQSSTGEEFVDRTKLFTTSPGIYSGARIETAPSLGAY
ncbi:MAG: hypothetical protein QM758_05870 [Armatimonas sp.]